MDHKPKVVPSVYIRELLKLMADFGVSPDNLLAGTGLTGAMLQEPSLLISYEQQIQIFSKAVIQSPVPDLGIRLGMRHHMYHHGTYGYAIQTCANFDQALRVACRFMPLAGLHLHVDLLVEEDFYCLVVKDHFPLSKVHRPFIEELIFSMYTSSNEFLEGQFRYKSVSLDYPRTEYGQQYTDLLNCPVYFDRPRTEIIIDRKLDALPLSSWDPQTSVLCVEHCEKILQRLDIGETFAEQVRGLLMKLRCDRRNADTVADRMHIGTRHLRRKLQAEGVTFQEVLNEVRCELAKDYLIQTQLPIDEIGALLGFSETTNFRRAFTKWMGSSPTQYRAMA